MFVLSPKRYKIQEYLLYQPVNVTRNLNSDIVSSLPIHPETTKFDQTTNTSTSETKSESEDGLYNLLNILAKIGGFYSFMNLVFGAVAGFVNNTLMKVELINQIKSKISNSKTNIFRINNSSTKSQSKIQPLSVIEEEKINCMTFDVFSMFIWYLNYANANLSKFKIIDRSKSMHPGTMSQIRNKNYQPVDLEGKSWPTTS